MIIFPLLQGQVCANIDVYNIHSLAQQKPLETDVATASSFCFRGGILLAFLELHSVKLTYPLKMDG